MTLSEPNQRLRLLTIAAWLLPLFSCENEKDMLEMIDAAVSMDLFKEGEQAMDVSCEVMNSVCYIYDANFCKLEELHKASAQKQLAESKAFLL